jgi:hypothetical protein
MIPNPPAVQHLLKTWSRIRNQVPSPLHAEYLSALFSRILKPALPFEVFIELQHLYFQDIPRETALEAWGIHFATTKDWPIPDTPKNAPALLILTNQTKPTA